MNKGLTHYHTIPNKMEKINNSWLGEKLNTTLPQKIASK